MPPETKNNARKAIIGFHFLYFTGLSVPYSAREKNQKQIKKILIFWLNSGGGRSGLPAALLPSRLGQAAPGGRLSQNLGQELPGSILPGMAEDLLGPALLQDAAPVHKQHLVPTSRAKPISWVTTTMVIPSRASSFMISSTSPTISGSRAEVGSSKSIILGFIIRARAMATRCFWPPESWAG